MNYLKGGKPSFSIFRNSLQPATSLGFEFPEQVSSMIEAISHLRMGIMR